jgi:CTD kinase subunit alpha
MDVAEGLLAMNPAKRLSATKALQMPYFTTEEPKMEKPTQSVICSARCEDYETDLTRLQGIGEHHEMSAKQERQRRKAESR